MQREHWPGLEEFLSPAEAVCTCMQLWAGFRMGDPILISHAVVLRSGSEDLLRPADAMHQHAQLQQALEWPFWQKKQPTPMQLPILGELWFFPRFIMSYKGLKMQLPFPVLQNFLWPQESLWKRGKGSSCGALEDCNYQNLWVRGWYNRACMYLHPFRWRRIVSIPAPSNLFLSFQRGCLLSQ